MNERFDVPESTGSLKRINKNGDDTDYQDFIYGTELDSQGTLRIDLRNLRPIRINDRDALVLEFYLADILRAVAVGVEQGIKAS